MKEKTRELIEKWIKHMETVEYATPVLFIHPDDAKTLREWEAIENLPDSDTPPQSD